MFEYQHLPRGANETLRDGNLAPFRNHLAPFGRSRYEFVAFFAMCYDYDLGTISLYNWIFFGGFQHLVEKHMIPKIVTMMIGVSWSNLTSTFFNWVAIAHQLDMIVCCLLLWPKIDWKNHAVRWDLWLFWFVCFCWMLLLCGGWVMSCFQEGRYAGGWWIYQQTWVDWISNSQWWNCLWLLLSTKQCRLFGRRRCTSFVGQGTWWSNFTDQHCIQCCTAVLDKPRFCCVSRWKIENFL